MMINSRLNDVRTQALSRRQDRLEARPQKIADAQAFAQTVPADLKAEFKAGDMKKAFSDLAVFAYQNNDKFQGFVNKALQLLDPNSTDTISLGDQQITLAGKFPRLFSGLNNVMNAPASPFVPVDNTDATDAATLDTSA